MNITQFRSISVSFGSMDFFYFKAEMLELQKSFLIIRFFNRISCRKDQNFMFLSCFFYIYLPPPPPTPYPPNLCWNVLQSERLLPSWRHTGQRITKIAVHGASQMEQKRGKCWKLPIIEGKLQVFISYLIEMKTRSFHKKEG